MFTEIILQQFDAFKIEIQCTLTKLCAFKASRGHPLKVVKLPIMLKTWSTGTFCDCVMNYFFFLSNQWSFLVVKYLSYHMFNHVVPVNTNCVIMSCLETDVGNFCEIGFSMTVQRDLQCQSHYDTLFTEGGKPKKACIAKVA